MNKEEKENIHKNITDIVPQDEDNTLPEAPSRPEPIEGAETIEDK